VYITVSDHKFATYICKKKDQYQEGDNIDIDLFMLQAMSKLKRMIETKTWNAPSVEMLLI